MYESLIGRASCLRVSSVLNKNAKEYGKQYMIDDCDDTCWNSSQGSPQWIQIEFPKAIVIKQLHLQFQGGFAGKDCWIEIKKNGNMEKSNSIHPEDNNSLQVFPIEDQLTDCLRIVFNCSTDFFGRIIVYKLDVLGKYD